MNPAIPAEPGRWAYVEAPRLVYSTLDWNPRLNGYSAYVPAGYVDDTATLAGFPSPESLRLLETRGVRYVLLHVGERNGFHVLPPAEAAAILAALPERAAAARYGDSWLIDLDPA